MAVVRSLLQFTAEEEEECIYLPLTDDKAGLVALSKHDPFGLVKRSIFLGSGTYFPLGFAFPPPLHLKMRLSFLHYSRVKKRDTTVRLAFGLRLACSTAGGQWRGASDLSYTTGLCACYA